MYSVVLKKVEGGVNVRTEEVKGMAIGLPEVGKRFFMYSEGLQPDSTRAVLTSEVIKITKSFNIDSVGEIVFQTENSVYSITYGPAELA